MTTKLHYIIDSHITPTSSEEKERVVNVLKDVFAAFNSRAGFVELIKPHVTGNTGPIEIKVLSWAIEVGRRFGRIHMHVILQVNHKAKFSLTSERDGINVTRRFKAWLIDRLPWLYANSDYYREYTTPYVRIYLADSSAENYAQKDRDDDSAADS